MNGFVQTFRRRLDTLNISDFHGLISPGLTCYLNSVLQVLFMTEEFRDRIKSCCTEEAPELETQLKDLFTALEKNRTRTYRITETLGIEDVYEQRDAAEYFEKILRLISPNVSQIFKGQLNHTTKCYKCKNRSDAPGFFWMLPLSIKDPQQTYRVENGLQDFFSLEKVDGENKMYCAKCEQKQEAIIMCEMLQPPDVLTLLLKRFHYDYELKYNVKLNCEAEVPFVLEIKGSTYDLYAIVKHYGNLTGGHYVAHINSVQTKEWYCFDDTRVKIKKNYLVPGKGFLRSRSAYLLMYRKRRKDLQNAPENKEEALISEDVAETAVEARKKREKKANDISSPFEEMTEPTTDTTRSTSSKSHDKQTPALNSHSFKTEYQRDFSIKQDMFTKGTTTATTFGNQKSPYKSVHRADNYSPRCRRKAAPTTFLQSASARSANLPVWKH